MRKVNGYSNNTDLQNTFRNFYENVKKKVTFFIIIIFYISHKNGIKTFIK